MPFIVKTSELEKLLNNLLNRLKELGLDEIQIDLDLYQTITKGEFDVTKNPEIGIGSFLDDWEHLEKIINDGQIFTFLDFIRTASILNAISETIIPIEDDLT